VADDTGHVGAGGLAEHAERALDIAFWGSKAKLAGEPLHALLEKQVHNRIMPHASAAAFDLTGGLVSPPPFKSTERLVGEEKEHAAEGFQAITLRLGILNVSLRFQRRLGQKFAFWSILAGRTTWAGTSMRNTQQQLCGGRGRLTCIFSKSLCRHMMRTVFWS
jgi:L-alanine-DL-glutamate epimerase-like enolase superfamily enzyme